MTDAARRCIAFVLAREGGYVDHPHDKGGRTYKGISERAHPEAWEGGQPSDAAVERIYHEHYWRAVGGDFFAEPLALALLDYAVHSGAKRALRDLAILLSLPRDAEPHDLAERARTLADQKIVALQLVIERASWLVRRALSVPGQDVFAKGWVSRMVELKRAVEAAPGG